MLLAFCAAVGQCAASGAAGSAAADSAPAAVAASAMPGAASAAELWDAVPHECKLLVYAHLSRSDLARAACANRDFAVDVRALRAHVTDLNLLAGAMRLVIFCKGRTFDVVICVVICSMLPGPCKLLQQLRIFSKAVV